ncbi:MAG: hypothetical protein JWL83_3018, partial [Actinomycetia bacterium]|nr:hypothetical protein [Actinomycetes bacterium]
MIPSRAKSATTRPGWARSGAGAATLVGAAAFALYYAGAGRPFGYDEAETVGNFVQQRSFLRPFTHQIVFNNHPLFSFALVLIARVAGTGEAWMRLLPAVLGAATVGVFAWWAQRRFGRTAAVAGVAVLATTPLFVGEVRQARGYATIVFCALVASILLVEDVRSRAGRVAYTGVIAVAVATHLYALLVVLGHFGFIMARPRERRERVADLAALATGVALGGLAYIGLWRAMSNHAATRRGSPHNEFPSLVAHGLLGRTFVSIALLVLLAGICARVLGRRPEIIAAITLPAIGVLWIWKVQRPVELYPRFMITAALPLAAAVAWTVRRYPRLLPVAIVAAVALFVPQIAGFQREPPVKATAHIVDSTRELGLRPCALSPWPLAAYTRMPFQLTQVEQAPQCDVLVQVGGAGTDLIPRLRS